MKRIICYLRGHQWARARPKAVPEPLDNDEMEVWYFVPYQRCERCGERS